jgi:mannose-1-phosphate guanylyltransferase
LGTIGPLRLFASELNTSFMVTNSDVAVDMDVSDFIEFHRKSESLLTVAVAKQTVSIEYGVMEIDDGQVFGFREKPTEEFCVSTGVYCMEPRILDYVPEGEAYGFDRLIEALLENKERVMAFDRTENWIDIGRIEDLRRAQEKAAQGLL